MSSLYSTYWYRIAALEPRLRRHVQVSRHYYRQQPWYVLRDTASGRHQRFNMAAYYLIGLMDGTKSLAEIWQAGLDFLGDDAPSQDEVITLLGQLHSTDLLRCDVSADTLDLFSRQKKAAGNDRRHSIANPFAMRFPLVDPDRFLQKWLFLVKPLFSWPMALFLFAVVGSGLVGALTHWPELSENIADRVLAPPNLLILWLVYPVVKLFHEFGHAFAVKVWGGEVHEMGIMLLAFTPIPYVEASASAAFSEKRHRMAVAAMGMVVEVSIAALALGVWLSVVSGLVSAIAYNVMLIGGVSTLLFNGNPLLRFDGYFILADGLEIPNLAQRSNRYLGYLVQRYLFGISEARSPVTASGEEFWLLVYGICAFIYRLLVITGLLLFVGAKFFFVGVLLAAWGAFSQVLKPAGLAMSRFFNSSGRQQKNSRVCVVALLSSGLLTMLFGVVPAPFHTRAEGVVWVPEQSQVRVGVDGVVAKVMTSAGSRVEKGDVLLVCDDPFLTTETEVLSATLQELEAQYTAEPLRAIVRRTILLDEITTLKADLHQHQERLAKLIIRSQANGIFILPEDQSLPGRFVNQGALLGYVVGDVPSMVRLVVSHKDISLVQEQTEAVQIRSVERLNHVMTTTIARVVPAAANSLPVATLGVNGGGVIPVDPTDPQGLTTLTKVFQLELALPPELQDMKIGGRVYVRFDHTKIPLGQQWYRSLRQLFLRQFNV